MNKIQTDKLKQINDIISVVKISSLLFSAIAIFNYIFGKKLVSEDTNNVFILFRIIYAVLTLSLIYCLWVFSTTKKIKARIIKHIKYIQFIEDIFFILISFMAILLSGAHESEFKYLFLFIIITTTIQSGMKKGVMVAAISSAIILSIDIIYAPHSDINQFFQSDLIMAGIFILTAWPLGFYVKIAGEYILELQDMVNIDGLTGVYNHRFFHDTLRQKISSKECKSISIIFLDIDYFKYYNDLYGHQKGDEVLKSIGTLLKKCVRDKDIVARYGGEEFGIILPETSERDAVEIAENIRKKVENTYFEGEENQPNGELTVSIGISVYPDKAKNDVELIKSADDALYRAKFFNKNRVETYTSILDELKKDIEEEHIDLVTSIKTLISVINAKDRYTYAHVERVVFYCRLIADKLKLSEEDKKNLIYGAYMHDIGKINISKEILNKNMPLTNEEWEVLKQHPANGVEIIKPVKSLMSISSLILHHHERYDGNGYPNNLKGDQIPYLARILTVVDSFDAMTSNRPYNKRKNYAEGIAELKRCSGTQFDAEIAEAFIEVIKENKERFDD